jgi:alpha-beta hydrolase superfamily lysophospholipase
MESVISRDGTTIAYDRAGEGPPVILVGGAFSYRRFPKTVALAEQLAGRFSVINYDRRGRGDSTDVRPYSVQREIDDLAALIDAAGGSASLWGWSSGAVLALRAAASGLGVERLALYEPPAIVDETHPRPPSDFARRLDEYLGSGDRSGAVRYYMTNGMRAPGLFVSLMRLLPVWSRLEAVAHTLPYDWALIAELMSGRPLAPHDWAGVPAPTLVMSGSKSPALLRQAAAAVAQALPDAQHRVLAGQGHNPSMKVQARVLDEFLAPSTGAMSPARELAGR